MSSITSPPSTSQDVLHVFDFDDTLVWQGGRPMVRVHTTHTCGTTSTRRVPWAEFWTTKVQERLQPNQTLDFSELDPPDLIRIEWTFRLLRYVVSKRGPRSALILTARADPTPIWSFLIKEGLGSVRVVPLGAGPDPGPDKARWLLERVQKGDGHLREVHFYEDRKLTLDLVRNTVVSPAWALYGCRVHLHHVTSKHRRALGLSRGTSPAETGTRPSPPVSRLPPAL